jgi:hypothetical protein
MKLNGRGENLFRSIRTDPVAKMNPSLASQGAPPLHFPLSAEKWRIRAQTPKFHHPFIAEILQMFEHHKPNHSTNRQRGAPLRAVKRSKGLSKTFQSIASVKR